MYKELKEPLWGRLDKPLAVRQQFPMGAVLPPGTYDNVWKQFWLYGIIAGF